MNEMKRNRMAFLPLALALALAFILALAMAGCAQGNDSPAAEDKGAAKELTEDAGGGDDEKDAGLTAEEFCALYEGTWSTEDGYLVYIGFQTETGEPVFVDGIKDSGTNYGPGAIASIETLAENEYRLTVDYPENDGEGFSYEAFVSNVHIVYRDGESKMLVIKIDDQPEIEYYFDDGYDGLRFDSAEDFLDYILNAGMGEMLVDPATDNFVQFFDIGSSPKFMFGTLGFNENSGTGEITDMYMDEYALVITVEFPEFMGNGGDMVPASIVSYLIKTITDTGIAVYLLDGGHMGDYYFGVG